jgi:excisionase family DNA binding protein
MTGRVLTSKTAAEYCGVAVQTLYNLISQGLGPKHYKHGRLNAFYEADLDDWNRARLTPAKSRIYPADSMKLTDIA